MSKLKTGLSLIVLGNVLYLAYTFFTKGGNSSFGDFASGVLLGISIGVNLIGIVLLALYVSNENKKENESKKENVK
ncbi:MAG: hypothetical protein MR938_00940 [Tenericutes bacterium]|nr:hypothetical protein [Mycoplasmatota bacterium]